jgi:hypothetical protein
MGTPHMLERLINNISGKISSKPTLRFFDEKYYTSQYPDVASHELSPLEHYLLIGWKDRYDPSTLFSTRGYLSANPDVAAIRINPLLHFLQHGLAEGRTGWEKSTSMHAPDPAIAR